MPVKKKDVVSIAKMNIQTKKIDKDIYMSCNLFLNKNFLSIRFLVFLERGSTSSWYATVLYAHIQYAFV